MLKGRLGIGSLALVCTFAISTSVDAQQRPWLSASDSLAVVQLEARIDSLRLRARYAEAVTLAEKVLKIRGEKQASWDGAEWWEVTTARLTLDSLQRMAKLSAPAQARMAQTDSLEKTIIGVSKEAASAAASVRDARKEHLPRGDINLLTAECKLGYELRGTNQYRPALDLLTGVLADSRAFLPGNHPMIANALLQYGWVLKDMARFDDAQAAYEEGLRVATHAYGPNRAEVADILSNLCGCLTESGTLDEAERVGNEALRIRRLYPNDTARIAQALNNLANVKKARGKVAESVVDYEEALTILQASNASPEWIATSHFNIASGMVTLGQYDDGLSHMREALRIDIGLFGEMHRFVAEDYTTLGELAQQTGAFAEAESSLVKGVAIIKAVSPDEPWRVAALADDLGRFYRETGRYAEARTILEDCVATNRAFYRGDHARVAEALTSVAVLYLETGDLFEAEATIRESLAMNRRLHKGDHHDTATSLHNLGRVLCTRGQYADADRFLRECLAMLQRLYDPDSELPATLHHNIGINFADQEKSTEAVAEFREALRIRRKIDIAPHRIANTERSLAEELVALGKFDEARALLEDALATYDRDASALAIPRSVALMALAKLELKSGSYDAAARTAQEALEIRVSMLGDRNQKVAAALTLCAQVERKRGREKRSAEYLARALNSAEGVRTQVLGDELDRAEFAGVLGLSEISEAYARSLCALGKHRDAVLALERGRGRALIDLLARPDVDGYAEARARLVPEQAVKLDALVAQEAALEQGVVAREGELQAYYRRTDVGEKEKARNTKRRRSEIVEMRVALADARAQVQGILRVAWPEADVASFKEFTAALAEGEVALSYVWSGDFVLALAVERNGNVQYWLLADSKEATDKLRRAVAKTREWLAHPPTGIDRTADANNLYLQIVPDGLRRVLAQCSRVVLCSDGALVDIPFEALVTSLAPERYWLDDGPEVVYSPSLAIYANRVRARDLDKTRQGGAVVIANPDFATKDTRSVPAQGALLSNVTAGGNAANAGLVRGDVVQMYDGQPVTTADELINLLNNVRASVEQGSRPATTLVPLGYWRAGATHQAQVTPARLGVTVSYGPLEESVRSLEVEMRGDKGVRAEVSALDQVRLFGSRLDNLPGTQREGEMIARVCEQNGVACSTFYGSAATVRNLTNAAKDAGYLHIATHGLTGSDASPYDASLALTPPQEPTLDDTGFLTLRDLVRGWRDRLDQCELVVLSGCDTQRGVRRGDSLLSLPWGFMYAGAPAVIASLWRVADERTADLMGTFYSEMISHAGEEKLTSMTRARRAFRAKNPHPYYWAPFVLVGDPR